MKIIPLLLALAVPVLAGEPPKINYDESKVGAVVLPDLLRTAHGETITTARQWEQQLLPEVWQLFQEHVYGRMPPRPADLRFGVTATKPDALGGKATRKFIRETTQSIIKNFPHWFTPTYRSYANRANACPVDRHTLVALIAPRPVYIASAVEDKWADPKGEFLSGKFAEPVYSLYEKKGLGVEEHPAVDQPVGDVIGYHMRTGKHDVTEYDWRQYLAFAARHFGVAAPH